MRTVSLQEAKNRLDELVEEAVAGGPEEKVRIFGLDQGKFVVPDNFDDQMPEIEQLFYAPIDDPSD